jgi:flagellar basal body-associated protein FliL
VILKIGLLLLMVLFVIVIVGLCILSYKMLNKVRHEEKAQLKSDHQYQLHPKLKDEAEQGQTDK